MPRNSSGTYTLPAAYNPVITGTVIESVWANTTLADVAQAVTDSLDRSGRGGMLAQFKAADGTTSAPGIAFDNSTTTGISRPSSTQLSFSITAAELFRLTPTGATFLVSPSYGADPVGDNDLARKAYVIAAATAIAGNYVAKAGDTMTGALINTSTVKIGNGAAGNSARLMVNTLSGTAAGIQLFQDGNESWIIQNPASSTALTFANSGAERMRIDSAGNIGIGAASSGRRLEVYSGAAQTDLLLGNTSAGGVGLVARWDNSGGNGYHYTTGAFPLLFGTNSAERMRIDASGNVGIGATSPTQRLDVRGTILSLVGSGGTLLLGDSNNTVGIRSIPTAGDSALGFYTQALSGNSERMRIDAAGDVGIGGASTSGWRLQVNASPVAAAGNATALRLRNTSDGGVSVLFDNAAGVLARLSAAVTSTGVGTDDGVLTFETTINGSLTERMRIDSSGNVGIGTANPGARLDVAGGGSSLRVRADGSDLGRLQFTDAAASVSYAFVGTPAANTLALYTNGLNERMRVDSSGNVGIGTTAPDSKLDVNGAARIRGGLSIYSPTTDRMLIEPQSAGSGTLLLSVNAANTAYTPMRFDGSPLIFNVAGSERMRLAGSELLIGTTGGYSGYSSALTFNFAGLGTQYGLTINTPDTSAGLSRGITFAQGGNGSGGGVLADRGYISYSSGGLSINGSPALVFQTTGGERMRITSGGDVGIGTDAPAASLETRGDGNRAIRIRSNTGATTRLSLLSAGVFEWLLEGDSSFRIIQDATTVADITSARVFRYGGIEIGYRGLPTGSVSSGSFGATDNGKRIKATAGVTIPNNTMADGDIVHVLNTTGSAITITKSITTAYNKNTGSALGATFTLAARGSMTIEFTSATECYVGGNIS